MNKSPLLLNSMTETPLFSLIRHSTVYNTLYILKYLGIVMIRV